jgi:hypothetical protein
LAAGLVLFLGLYAKAKLHKAASHAPLLISTLLAVAAGGAVGINFQLLTGYNAQHGHFLNRVILPVTVYAAGLMVLSLPAVRTGPRSLTVALPGLLIVGLLTMASARQIETGRNTAQYQRLSNPDMAVLMWLREHVPADSVLGSTDRDLLTLIPGITGMWTFVPLGDRSMASTQEILTRYLMLARLQGQSWTDVEGALTSEGYSASLAGLAAGLSYALVLDEHRLSPGNLAQARSIWDHLELPRDFQNRRMDYLITKNATLPPLPDSLGTLDAEYRNAVWRVLKVQRKWPWFVRSMP